MLLYHQTGKSYDIHSFEADLRHVMKRAGVKGERICFIFDESNVLGPAFLERMNALLAGGEVIAILPPTHSPVGTLPRSLVYSKATSITT